MNLHKTIIELYPNISNKDIAERLGLTLNQVRHIAVKYRLKKSEEYITAYRKKLSQNTSNRFVKGQTAWNKGTKGVMKNGIQTQFKKGQVPHNIKPIGHLSKSKKYVTIKTESGYRPLHRVIWEQHYGAVPPKKYVTFKDGNTNNIDINNLELIDWQHHMLKNHTCKLPKELQEVINIKKQIVRFINNGKKQNK